MIKPGRAMSSEEAKERRRPYAREWMRRKRAEIS
jgi:hypothetical protein